MHEISDIGPIVTVGTLAVGGIGWLTRLHQIALDNRKNIAELKKEISEDRNKISTRIEELEKITSRIDGKLDLMFKILERDK